MINYIYYADQTAPLSFCKKTFKNKLVKNRVANYLNNINNIKELKLLSEQGCTYAFIANVLVNQFLSANKYEYDDELFKSIFGFSLLIDDESLDNNIMMVDLFKNLLNVVKINTHKYESYEFNNTIEAANNLLNIKCNNESEAMLKLFDAGYIADGKTFNGKNKYKNKIPQNKTYTGTYKEIGKELLNLDPQDFTMEKFKNIMHQNNITYDVTFDSIPSKFSGINSSANMNYWVNYYLSKKGTNVKIESTPINNDFKNYEEFKYHINFLINDGYSIGISSNLNSNLEIVSTDTGVKAEVSTKTAGHQMMLTGFDNNNIIVDSWGKSFSIKKENYQEYTYSALKVNYDAILNKNYQDYSIM